MRVLIRSHSKFPYPEVIDGKVLIHAGACGNQNVFNPAGGAADCYCGGRWVAETEYKQTLKSVRTGADYDHP